MKDPTRAYKAGKAHAEALIEVSDLMYNERTKFRFLCGIQKAINNAAEEAGKVVRRKKKSQPKSS